MTRPLRLGTRASRLATTQSEWVAERIRSLGHAVELVLVSTHGDVSDRPLTEIGGTGVFVSALREALLADQIDLAVHSLKDLPVAAAPGLVLAAVPEREDPRDVLVSATGRGLADLPEGALVGTGSPRRAAQLRALASPMVVAPVRGNVDTRIGQVRDGTLDAVVLAAAGLRRLGRIDEASELLDPEVMLPAPGQGALAVECRDGDEDVRELLAALDHAETRAAVTAERAVLARLEAGCTAPVAALARVEDGQLRCTALLAHDLPAGTRLARAHAAAPPERAAYLGHELADRLLADVVARPDHRPRPGGTGDLSTKGVT